MYNLIGLMKDKPILLRNGSAYYETKNVLNIQISTDFFESVNEIKE